MQLSEKTGARLVRVNEPRWSAALPFSSCLGRSPGRSLCEKYAFLIPPVLPQGNQKHVPWERALGGFKLLEVTFACLNTAYD